MQRDDTENTFLDGLQDQHGDNIQEKPVPPYTLANAKTTVAHLIAPLQAVMEESAGSGSGMPSLAMSLPDTVLNSSAEAMPASMSMPQSTTPHPSKSTIAAQHS